jgi:two-component system, cell cycle sensor histidine kinase PleC
VPLEIDCPVGSLLLYADELRIKQIIINLLSNAIKFSPATRRVRLTARLDNTGWLEIAVIDRGPGMNAEEVIRALQPFQQIDNPANKRHEGTGLGLPLATRLAELHGGQLHIDSEPGRGTTARLRLAADRLRAAPVRRAAS